ncbi:MAG: hypothetical protein J1F69_03935 [Clostridiales bacterium]|nr:hypothetical protein [Clostridiales bacterium]
MKTKAKKSIIAASLACVALGSALCFATDKNPASAEKAVAVPASNLAACERALKTAGKGVQSLVSGYNKTYGVEWAASEIEYSAPVLLLEDNTYGMYLDFDGDNGYAVMTTDNKIYGLKTHGDLQVLRDGRKLYFGEADGLVYVNDNGMYEKYEQDSYLFPDEVIQSRTKGSNQVNASAMYSAQASGDGMIDINSLPEYVAANYPKFYADVFCDNMVADFKCSVALDTAYYVKKYDNGNKDPDANYALTAMYNALRDWGKRGHLNVPYTKTNDITDIVLDDYFYSTYGLGTKKGKDANGNYKWVANEKDFLNNMPVLYSNLRGYAINKGYTPEGGFDHPNITATLEYVAKTLYNNKMQILHTQKITDVFLKSISNSQASVLNIEGSSTYGNHTVAVMGYYRYTKLTNSDPEHTNYEHIYFYIVADGESDEPYIFDPNMGAKLDFYCLPRC